MDSNFVPLFLIPKANPSTENNTGGKEERITNGTDQDEVVNKLQLELSQANHTLSENINKLRTAQETISKQQEQLLDAAKLMVELVENQKRVATTEKKNRLKHERTTKLLEQTIGELENEKKMRNKAEIKVSEWKAALKGSSDSLATVFQTIIACNESEKKECLSEPDFAPSNIFIFTDETPALQNQFSLFSSSVQLRLDKLSQRYEETRRKLAENIEMIEILDKVAVQFHKQQYSVSSNSVFSSSLETANQFLNSERSSRKRKASGSITAPFPLKKQKFTPQQTYHEKRDDAVAGEMNEVSSEPPETLKTLHSGESTLHIKCVPPLQFGTENLDSSRNSLAHKKDPTDPSSSGCICGFKATHKASLDLHIQRYTTAIKFVCRKCDKGFEFASILKHHYRSMHNIVWKDSFGCRICGKCFVDRRALMTHHQNIHRNPWTSSMVEGGHHHTLNGTPMKTLAPQVDKVKTGKDKEPVILELHGRDRSKPKNLYYCLCGRKFHILNSLYAHTLSKRTMRSFKCTLCPKTFAIHANLKLHVTSFHKKKYENQKYGCMKCGLTFSIMEELRNHRKFGHLSVITVTSNPENLQGEIPSVKEKILENVICSTSSENLMQLPLSQSESSLGHGFDTSYVNQLRCICGNTYGSKNALVQHIRLQNEEPKFKCDKCTMSFVFVSHLKAHYLRRHNIARNFLKGCRRCGKTFRDKKSLRAHQIAVHSMKFKMRAHDEQD